MSCRRVGYRFLPTDEELITHFLKHKMDGSDSSVNDDIGEIEICKVEPWELPGRAAIQSDDQVWYFFCPRRSHDFKSADRKRVKRSTKAGYWKSTGTDRKIKVRHTKNEIGTKKTLVFHLGRVPNGVKTDWIIHEYEPKTILPHQRPFVLCKLMKQQGKKNDSSASDEVGPGSSPHMPSNFENHPIEIQLSQEDAEAAKQFLESITASNGFDFNNSSVQWPIDIENCVSFEDIFFDNGFSDDANELRFPLEANEQEEDPIRLADSFLVDPEKYGDTENSCAYENQNYICALSRVPYYEDNSDTDVEFVHAKSVQHVGTSKLYGGHASSKEYRRTRTVQPLTEILPAPNSGIVQCGSEMNGEHHDEICMMMAALVASDTDEDIKCTELVYQEFPVYEKKNKLQHQQRSGDIVEAREVAPGRSNIGGELSKKASEHKASKATKSRDEIDLPQRESSINLPKKEELVSIVESKKDWNIVPAETSLKMRPNESASNNRIVSFIHLETPPLSRKQNPPFIYVVNVLIGLVLFTVLCGQVLVLH